ncbi:MAG: amidase [Bacteroidales bacterium]|jgi:amidase|nr:amidase [Bacteroidales bacterium]
MKKLIPILTALLLAVLFACNQTPKEKETTAEFRFEEYTITQLQQGYDNGDFTVTDVVQAYLDRIEAIDDSGPMLNAVIQTNPDALAIAAQLDEEIKEGKKRGPMHGVPVLLKDNIDTHDQMATTAGSRALSGSHPLQDSYIAMKLREAGAVILGKANLSEWANFRGNLSSSGWSGVGGQTKNPYILDRNPCGSSSGSGVAVSANLCMIAIGTETNGSIVCPSTANGIVGIKPTVGLLSRTGIVPISFTQDTPGPMGRTVRDAAIALGVMTGVDANDSRTAESEGKYLTDYTSFLKEDGLNGKKLGWFTSARGRHFKVDTLMQNVVEHLRSLGAEVIEIDNIYDREAGSLSYELMLYEFKDGLNKYFASLGDNAPVKSVEELIEFNRNDSIELRYYDQELLIEAQAKGSVESAEFIAILGKMNRLVRDEGIDRVMREKGLDAFIAPTGSPAWKTDLINGDCFHVSSSSPAAMAGYPNITVPMGFIDGLPVGISFFGKAWSEPRLLEMAYAFEASTKQRKAPAFIPVWPPETDR